jgi:hypothetical protein
MVKVSQANEHLTDVHILSLATRVHPFGVAEQRFGKDSQDQGERLIKRNHKIYILEFVSE